MSWDIITLMTPDEFCTRVDEILVEREHTLKEHQVYNLHLYKKIVQRTGVRPIDEYYLTIVGVPTRGFLKRYPFGMPKKKVKKPAVQENLF